MKHKISEVLLYKLSKGKYKEVRRFMQKSMEMYADGQQDVQKYSLLDAMKDFALGLKYWFVLLERPYIRVKGTKVQHPYETSSDIFFTEREAWQYYEMMRESRKNSWRAVRVIAFRTKEQITLWNSQRDPDRTQLY